MAESAMTQAELKACPFCGGEVESGKGIVRHPYNDACPLGQIAFYTSIESWNAARTPLPMEGDNDQR